MKNKLHSPVVCLLTRGTITVLSSIFLCFILTYTSHAQPPSQKKKQNSVYLQSTTPATSAEYVNSKFLSGSWSGTGVDIINAGFKDSLKDGHNYDIALKMLAEDDAGVQLEGSVSVSRKTETGSTSFTRHFSGNGIRNGNVIRINYQFDPEKDDNSDGVGIMIIQFSTTDHKGTGYYISRSPISGALVNGKLSLHKL